MLKVYVELCRSILTLQEAFGHFELTPNPAFYNI